MRIGYGKVASFISEIYPPAYAKLKGCRQLQYKSVIPVKGLQERICFETSDGKVKVNFSIWI
jgi:hypothetical protein